VGARKGAHFLALHLANSAYNVGRRSKVMLAKEGRLIPEKSKQEQHFDALMARMQLHALKQDNGDSETALRTVLGGKSFEDFTTIILMSPDKYLAAC
jgi:hypothetical protein